MNFEAKRMYNIVRTRGKSCKAAVDTKVTQIGSNLF